MGIERIVPAYELAIEDLEKIKETGVEIEVVVHGKIPLGIGHECFLLNFEDLVGKKCPEICREDLWLRSEDIVLKPFGQVTLSGKDVCMYEHLEKLEFADAIRVESLSETSSYRKIVGSIYRKRLERGFSEEDFKKLVELAEVGLCNGFYFNRAGQIYVPGD
jgi:putative protease